MYASDLKHSQPSLEEKLRALYGLTRGAHIELGFRAPYLKLLEALGNPHLKLPPVIHVAGTNGKGSTIAFMRAMLEAAGYRVHVYTSPHLIQFNERIVLAGEPISNDALEPLIDEVLQANAGGETTFFEITTALAFTAFSRTPADIVLLEVGLGGRLDCTNIIESPALSVITPVSMDHMDFLGDTIESIAKEKAGIMKHGAPCVIGAQDPRAWPIFKSQAESMRMTLFRNGSDWVIREQGVHICFETGAQTHLYPHPSLTGLHQIENAGLALAAMKILEAGGHFRITDDSLAKGLQNAHWPARLQKLEHKPGAYELWLDGGHNADAGQAIARQADIWAKADGKPLYLVLGMMAHKDVLGYLTPIIPHLSGLYVTNIPGEPKALAAQDLRDQIGTLAEDTQISASQSWQDAVHAINERISGDKRILVAGSLYLAGSVLQERRDRGHNSA
ncbi:MAG: bifunctional folylpolyglutamate synthase/dihydrofolate synthase [Alphaproteobacteria bacterium]|nr:bifunctional folylpolyglutamate synthase/dihydrofolate synthase [Alphaproteobacteria bacterium]